MAADGRRPVTAGVLLRVTVAEGRLLATVVDTPLRVATAAADHPTAAADLHTVAGRPTVVEAAVDMGGNTTPGFSPAQ
jgi:hypothetical protein